MLCDCGAKMFVVENVTLKDKNIRKLKCKKCGYSFISVEHKCSNCKYWHYDCFTEKALGMGVGKCRLDNSEKFCSGNCAFFLERLDGDTE